MSTSELTSKIRELKELKSYAEEIAEEIAALEDIIKAEMIEREPTRAGTVILCYIRSLKSR